MHQLQLAPISGRRSVSPEKARWIAPSLAVHAIVLLPALIDLAPRLANDDRPAAEVLFLAPLLPKREPHQASQDANGVRGLPNGWSSIAVSGLGDGAPLGAALGHADGVGHSGLAQAQRDLAAEPSPDPASAGDEHIYQAVDVDREVAREADAAAPIYPETLRLQNIAGAVTVEFVVDTLGRVENGSMHVIGATHPLFAAAVRDAAPDMKFQPAIRAGHVVRQQVIQSFQFVIQPPGARSDSTIAAAKAKVP